MREYLQLTDKQKIEDLTSKLEHLREEVIVQRMLVKTCEDALEGVFTALYGSPPNLSKWDGDRLCKLPEAVTSLVEERNSLPKSFRRFMRNLCRLFKKKIMYEKSTRQ